MPDYDIIIGAACAALSPAQSHVSTWPKYLRRKMERGEVAREEEEKEI